MAKRKNKKLARLKKTIFIFLFSTIYLFINIILFFGSFRFLNMKSITVNNVIYMFILSFLIGIVLGILAGIKHKNVHKVYKKARGLIVALPVIAVFIFVLSLGFNHFKIEYITDQLELQFEEYDYFIDFDDIEKGYNYRIDEDTDYLYYIKNYEIKSVKPVKISSFKDDYKLDTYKLNRGYVIINNDKVYYTRYSISENSKLYKINLPIDYIMKNYNMKEYYYLKGSDFNFINEEYASEQDNEKLYLFKKFKGNIYTKEKLYDLRIQVKNNFDKYYDAIYKKNYVRVDIDGKKYNIKFTFNDKLDVIYSKEVEK